MKLNNKILLIGALLFTITFTSAQGSFSIKGNLKGMQYSGIVKYAAIDYLGTPYFQVVLGNVKVHSFTYNGTTFTGNTLPNIQFPIAVNGGKIGLEVTFKYGINSTLQVRDLGGGLDINMAATDPFQGDRLTWVNESEAISKMKSIAGENYKKEWGSHVGPIVSYNITEAYFRGLYDQLKKAADNLITQQQTVTDVNSLTQRGEAAFKNGDYQNAVKYYEGAIALLPNNQALQDRLDELKGYLNQKVNSQNQGEANATVTSNQGQSSAESNLSEEQSDPYQQSVLNEQRRQDSIQLANIERQNEIDQMRNEALDSGLEQINRGNYQAAAYTFADAGLVEATAVAAGAAMATGIIEAAQKEREQNIRNKTKYLNSALKYLPEEDEQVRQLFLNRQYAEFFDKEKELTSTEESALSNAVWLIDRGKQTQLNSLYREIMQNRQKRVRQIMIYQTDTLVKLFKTLRNAKLITEYNNRNQWDKNRIGNYFKRDRDSRYRQQLISDWNKEKLERFQKILYHDFQEDNFRNMDNRVLDDFHLIQFYLSNPYSSDEFDQWFSTKFLELDLDDQKDLLKEILDIRNRTIDLSGPVTAPKPSKNDAKLRLLLGNGDKLNYYMDVRSWFYKSKPFALYEYLDRQSSLSGGIWSGFKKTRANELVQQWIKRDEEKTGKSANHLFIERMDCKTADCRFGNYVTKTKSEAKGTKKEIGKVNWWISECGNWVDIGERKLIVGKHKKAEQWFDLTLNKLNSLLKRYPNNEELINAKKKYEKEINDAKAQWGKK